MYIKTINLSEKNLNQEVKMIGWVKNIKKMGSICFIELRDCHGVIQIVVKENSKIFEKILFLTKESLIEVIGKLSLKFNKNKNIKNNNYEILISDIKIINKAELIPFKIKDETDGLEKIRLKYRFLDLRRNKIKLNLFKRFKVLNIIRNYFYENNFIEIETPILSFPTIEGANNFIVESNNKKGYFFALPQSPQLYKQTLMNSGFDSYFQIAKCFRDEDLRNDRQPEFTQLDLEVCFAKKEEIMFLLEKMIKKLWKELNFNEIINKFKIITYEESISKYGNDKPDLRFDLEIKNIEFLKTPEDEIARGIWFEGNILKENYELLRNEISKITNKPLIIYCKNMIMNLHLSEIEIIKTKNKSLIAIISDEKTVNTVLSQVRNILGNILKLIDENKYEFCWVINSPMFEYSNIKKKYVSLHHPFTLPKDMENFNKKWETSLSTGFDLVLNGIELGSGSERIYDETLQKKIFNILGMNEKQIEKEFGFFLDSMKFGYPPHAGFAIGIDRFIMIILKTKSIRDVIAFPKTLNFNCLFSKSPRKKIKKL